MEEIAERRLIGLRKLLGGSLPQQRWSRMLQGIALACTSSYFINSFRLQVETDAEVRYRCPSRRAPKVFQRGSQLGHRSCLPCHALNDHLSRQNPT